jgi:acetate kinase
MRGVAFVFFLHKIKLNKRKEISMSNAIAVLNAGSSSIKFSLFVEEGQSLKADVRGQVEGIYNSARFVSKAPDGTVKAEKSWPEGFQLGHDGALIILSNICGRNLENRG